jgi:hypothetical protein
MGVGALKADPPASQVGRTKDGGVDVVAWRPFADQRPGVVIAYGQVASGLDWRDKAVTNDLHSDFLNWMSDEPALHYLPLMFVPFVQHEDVRPTAKRSFDTVTKDRLSRLEKRLGVVVDRFRMTELLAAELTSPDVTAAVAVSREWLQQLIPDWSEDGCLGSIARANGSDIT